VREVVRLPEERRPEGFWPRFLLAAFAS
jgi:hypothetical protein